MPISKSDKKSKKVKKEADSGESDIDEMNRALDDDIKERDELAERLKNKDKVSERWFYIAKYFIWIK